MKNDKCKISQAIIQKKRFDPLYSDEFAREKTVIGDHDSRFILNVKINKSILEDKANIYLFGTDILFGNDVESVNQLITSYPRQVGSMFGFGISYNMK